MRLHGMLTIFSLISSPASRRDWLGLSIKPDGINVRQQEEKKRKHMEEEYQKQKRKKEKVWKK